MKILLLGCEGQVGWELQRSLAPLGEVIALGRQAQRNPNGLWGDLAQPDTLAQTVRNVRPQVIVNAAAHTAVDRAESEPELARTINATAPGVLAQQAQALGAWLVHYSTDYVFDGTGQTPWREDDATAPLSVYGRTKREGEMAALATCERCLVLRTSWVHSARGGNFAKTMIRLARERTSLKVINDQYGAPTGADLLADVTAHLLRAAAPNAMAAGSDARPLAGIYHVAASGVTTWHEYAKYVLALVAQHDSATPLIAINVEAVPSSAFKTAAQRPKNSRLDTTKLQSALNLVLPPWQQGVQRMLKEIDYGRSI